MTAFVHLSQDLPKYAASLARNVGIPDEIAQTAARLSIQHPFGPALLINGRVIRDPEQTPFGCVTFLSCVQLTLSASSRRSGGSGTSSPL